MISVCQCHSLVPETARKGRAGGGLEAGGAGNAVYLDVYGQMAYSEI